MAAARKGRKQTVAKARAQGARRRSKVAADAVEKAKQTGSTGDARKRNAQQKVTRDTAIIARGWAGVPTKVIAEEMEVTQRTVQRVIADFESAPSGLNEGPMEIVERLSRTYLRMFSDFMALAKRYEGQYPAASIGAIRQARETMSDYVTLLASIGKLPTDLEVLAAQADLLRMGDLILEAIERLERGEISAAQLGELVRGFVLAKGLPPGQVIEGRESDSQDGKRKRKRGGGPTAT